MQSFDFWCLSSIQPPAPLVWRAVATLRIRCWLWLQVTWRVTIMMVFIIIIINNKQQQQKQEDNDDKKNWKLLQTGIFSFFFPRLINGFTQISSPHIISNFIQMQSIGGITLVCHRQIETQHFSYIAKGTSN